MLLCMMIRWRAQRPSCRSTGGFFWSHAGQGTGPCAGLRFDAVVASEVIEHVDSVPGFCASLAALTRPGGGVVISTINRTPRSYALAIVAAEYVLGLVPRGTHQWERFVTPGVPVAYL